MTEQRSPLKEFRHLAEKLETVGLSPSEQARYRQLKEMVSPEASTPRPGFDVNAAAEALKASLEPAGRRPARPAPEPAAPAFDPGAPGYDPTEEPWDPGQVQDPGARAWDPNPPLDPGAPYPDTAAQPGAAAPGAAARLDPGSGALNQGPVDDGSGAAWDPGAPGSYDQAAWDAGTPLPPLDPAAAVDPDGPAFDAAGRDEGQAGSWDAGVASGPEPAVRSYDLGPAAFDAAALPPPEPGPGDYDQARWDAAAGEAPQDPAAGSPPEGEPLEAELVDAELVESEPLPEAPAPGPDFFTPGPLTPDFTGAQPLDAGRFGEGEPGLPGSPGAGGWPEEEVAAEPEEVATAEPEEVAAGSGFEPAEAGGPGAVEAGTPPDAIEIGAGAEAEGAAAEEVPLASPSEFLSSLGPAARPAEPPASPAVAPDLGEEVIEDPSPVEVDVEEVAVAPPAPARPATALDVGGPSPTFVAGEHRVVVHTLEGQVLRGTIADVDLDATAIPLVAAPGNAPERVAAARVKAIFFMLLPGGRPPAPEGSRVRVTFRDGRQVAGFSPDYDPEAVGFFMIPADSRTNTGRIWVYRAAVRQVSVS